MVVVVGDILLGSNVRHPHPHPNPHAHAHERAHAYTRTHTYLVIRSDETYVCLFTSIYHDKRPTGVCMHQ